MQAWENFMHTFTYDDVITSEQQPVNDSTIFYLVELGEPEPDEPPKPEAQRKFSLKAISGGLQTLAFCPTSRARGFWPIDAALLRLNAEGADGTEETLRKAEEFRGVIFPGNVVTGAPLRFAEVQQYLGIRPTPESKQPFNQGLAREIAIATEGQLTIDEIARLQAGLTPEERRANGLDGYVREYQHHNDLGMRTAQQIAGRSGRRQPIQDEGDFLVLDRGTTYNYVEPTPRSAARANYSEHEINRAIVALHQRMGQQAFANGIPADDLARLLEEELTRQRQERAGNAFEMPRDVREIFAGFANVVGFSGTVERPEALRTQYQIVTQQELSDEERNLMFVQIIRRIIQNAADDFANESRLFDPSFAERAREMVSLRNGFNPNQITAQLQQMLAEETDRLGNLEVLHVEHTINARFLEQIMSSIEVIGNQLRDIQNNHQAAEYIQHTPNTFHQRVMTAVARRRTSNTAPRPEQDANNGPVHIVDTANNPVYTIANRNTLFQQQVDRLLGPFQTMLRRLYENDQSPSGPR